MNCIVFDKTGTLTIGKPVVVNTKLLKNMAVQEFYELVAATEVILIHNINLDSWAYEYVENKCGWSECLLGEQ